MQRKRGFTLVEMMIVVAIIAILAAFISVTMYRRKSQAKLARVTTELNLLSTALAQYAEDNNYQYPADAGRGVPAGLEKYMPAGTWPITVWPQGVFDYDSWIRVDAGPNLGKQVYQMSYRLCDTGDPIADCSDPVLFPNFTRYSAIYYCISGPCIPHVNHVTDPGYCVNCKPKEQNY